MERAEAAPRRTHPLAARWLRRLGGLILVYVLLGAFAWLFADRLIFLPPAPSEPGPGVIRIPVEGGGEIAALWKSRPGLDGPVVLFSHGNAEDLGRIRSDLRRFVSLGSPALGYDYPGYGLSDGSPSTDGANRAADAAYRYLVEDRKIPPGRIVLYGRSVGSGPSMHLAAGKPVGGVILQSPFVSAFRVMTRWPLFPFDRFDNLAAVREYDGPLLILHGTKDEVIAPWHGRRLYDESASSRRKLIRIEGAGHNDMAARAPREMEAAVRAFLDGIPKP